MVGFIVMVAKDRERWYRSCSPACRQSASPCSCSSCGLPGTLRMSLSVESCVNIGGLLEERFEVADLGFGAPVAHKDRPALADIEDLRRHR